MIDCCVKRWDFEELDLILKLMEKESVTLNLDSCKVLIDGITGYGKLEKAERLVSTMHDKKLRVETYLYNLIMNGYCRFGLVEKAFELHSKMSSRGVTPNKDTYWVLMNGLCKVGKVCEAMSLLNELRVNEFEIDEAMYITLPEGCYTVGMIEKSLEVVAEMSREGFLRDAKICEILADALIEVPERGTNDGYIPSSPHGFTIDLIHRRSNASSSRVSNTQPGGSPYADTVFDTYEYLMKLQIGTPPFEIEAALDTGSELIWTQCLPCLHCYDQNAPIFDPSKSSTFKEKRCNTHDHSCSYEIVYADKSYTKGTLATETVTIHSTSGEPFVMPETIIGCGGNNSGFRPSYSGIVGLTRGSLSLISQMGGAYPGFISYCFAGKGTSKINFGANAIVAGDGVVSTSMFVMTAKPGVYYLNLDAVSVGDTRIETQGTPFHSLKGNIVIDSGTPLTYFPVSYCNRVRKAVKRVVTANRVADPSRNDMLCYYSNTIEIFPVITMHFSGGADLVLDKYNIMIVLFLQIITCFLFTTTASPPHGFTIDLIHRRSNASSSRLSNTQLGSSPYADTVFDNSVYLMKLQVGTPPFEIEAVIDTGSEITWTQCLPCVHCYEQNAPIFDPSKSSTFKEKRCHDHSCPYEVDYFDKTYTKGTLATETVTIHSTSGEPFVMAETIIGCGRNNSWIRPSFGGFVGLNWGPLSLITQMGGEYPGLMSYCFAGNGTSKINFGTNAIVGGGGVVSTTMFVTTAKPGFYYLNLDAVSVGDTRIETLGTPFHALEGNIVIDSGTTLTYFPESYCNLVRQAVEHVVPAVPAADPTGNDLLCYYSNTIEIFPVITMHFSGGADLVLDKYNMYMESYSGGLFCLAIMCNNPTQEAIFGNRAQHNFLVGYDSSSLLVSFSPTDCSALWN
ncbi:Aspartic peptidase domain superfamily [Arabidopsis thaliana x Arabidopsis arenosa]|uniref:Aspartic peptidase domain superfamily n=1 Tax=Arabidopsis thaliana x Arabidopsis arenosa TaxID=1240361 RepID=A0A8T2A8M2_9BRAS|nr:Aspartic peptidase domain superfamily [Arabidopsis thaliana x Arabidopsis arenosa]